MKTVIVAGGKDLHLDALKESLKDASFVIGADSGAEALLTAKRSPDLVIGDLDSLSSESISRLRSCSIVYQYPCDKDLSDLELAFGYAEREGARSIEVFGWSDARLDYSWANIIGCHGATAKTTFISSELKAHLLNVSNSRIKARAQSPLQRVSVIGLGFPLSLSSKGLRWELDWRAIHGPKMSLSNEFTGDIEVKLESGSALVLIETLVKSKS